MKKIITLTLVAMLAITLAGCGTTEYSAEPSVESSGEPNANGFDDWSYETWTEELDLSLVVKYEFDIVSYEERRNVRITIDNVDDVQKLNDFLGNVVTVTHSNEACLCDYETTLLMILTTGRLLRFGVERNWSDDTFNLSDNGMSVIRLDNLNYDDFMDLVMSFRND